MNVTSIFDASLNCVYPPFCIVCHRMVPRNVVLCPPCDKHVVAPPPYRYRLGTRRVVVVHAAGAYQPPLDGLVRAKGQSLRSAAVPLGALVSAHLQRLPYTYDVIIPVPLYWIRYALRGYNQAAVMAKVISDTCGIRRAQPFMRVKHTQAQQQLNKQQRKDNVSQAFDLFPGWRWQMASQLLKGKRVLIVDDVFTTGATVAALAKEVWRFSPACVHAAVACRVLDP